MMRRLRFICVAAIIGVAVGGVGGGVGSGGGGRVDAAMAPNCQGGGVCKVGDVGPAGGIVYYDAGSPQWWGQYLEAQTISKLASGPWSAEMFRAIEYPSPLNKAIGMGLLNSLAMTRSEKENIYSRNAGYFGIFSLPSKDELDALYNYWRFTGDKRLNYKGMATWTSSEASDSFAWYQLFQDGTQFTDANGIIRGLKSNKNFITSPKHVGSNFLPTTFQVIGVRAFGPKAEAVSMPKTISATKSNSDCSRAIAPACSVGDIGPGGGIVFYDAGKTEYWGRWLEIAPQSCEGVRLPFRPSTVKSTKSVYQVDYQQSWLVSKILGMGRANTDAIVSAFGAGSYAAKFADDLVCGGQDDWFLPSKNELDVAYNRVAQNRVGGNDTPVGGFNKGYYWTSSSYNFETAWTQYFMDGQQFDRVQRLDGNKTPPTPFRVRPVRAFG
jgi:hypothetical protein